AMPPTPTRRTRLYRPRRCMNRPILYDVIARTGDEAHPGEASARGVEAGRGPRLVGRHDRRTRVKEALPIDEVLPEILETLRTSGSLVLEAPPGAGKTTRVPIAMLDAGIVEGEILVLQPRRLAARLAASRV